LPGIADLFNPKYQSETTAELSALIGYILKGD